MKPSIDMTQLLAVHKPPCISLYQPTHRCHPDTLQDPIRYRNSLKEMEASLGKKYSKHDVQFAMDKFNALAHDDHFWNHRTEGLAILGSSDMFQVFELHRDVPELLIVADSFHTKPLLRILQSADRYQILCLDRHVAKLYEGNRDVISPVDLTNLPSTIQEALGSELTEPHLTVASYGTGRGGQAMVHGHGGKKDEVDNDTERFFRSIDRAIIEHHSHPSELPLLLVMLPEHEAIFRSVSHNSFILEEGLAINPESLSIDELRIQAWQKIEPIYLKRLAELVEQYQIARSGQLGSDDLVQVSEASIAGRVSTLLIEADRQVPGRVNLTGEIASGKLSDPEVGDVLNDLTEIVLRMKGKVVVVPQERMPSATGLAATFRY